MVAVIGYSISQQEAKKTVHEKHEKARKNHNTILSSIPFE